MQLLPKDEKFFDLFVRQAGIFRKATKSLREAAESGTAAIGERQPAIADLEKESDETYRDVLERLNRTFITPIDPEDVSQIATGLESLTDDIESLAFRLSACDLDPLPAAIPELTKHFDDSAAAIEALFDKLRREQMRGKDGIRADCARARDLITKVIGIVREDLRRIYQREKDPIALITLKDIYDRFDATAHDYQRFTDTIQNVVAKNI